MSNQSAPAAPDYTPIAAASAESAKIAAQTSKDQLDWAKQTYADNKGVTDQVVDKFLTTQDTNDKNAAADRARYEGTFQPLEDSLAADAKSYSSDDRRNLEMGRAGATVGQNFEAARTNAQRDLEGFGVNPGATRFAALDVGARAQEAATKAGAQNQAGVQVDATGRALRSEAINVGRGYPGQIAGEYNTATQTGTGAVNTGLATTASGANTMGTAPQWNGQATSALNTWGNTLNMGYNNQLGQFNADQNASSGLGTALGLGASMLGKGGAMAAGGALAFMADGGEVGDTPGGAIPVSASPTGGRQTDDVPSQLTAGEFVMPKQAVEWHGQKAMYAMIDKANKQRAEAKQRTGAVPAIRAASTQRPAFASRPSAIPMQRAA